ncbi:BAD_collapsed_G0031290.mRNA.1.CDS.1 [Saccharomyces cerevisiae]|nr:CFA_G0030600.mRNA.1.CDS.1 [Saccharomyces cerevisiae]CAI7366254.1 CFA_G0030600.mRNA.1.CDS.1 [Saccharomyces cerevisiae]CAI7371964.1 BAD_collapsed_G0031290.mRNA.1.CDS.1 [Saccharomyces cerevisiae]
MFTNTRTILIYNSKVMNTHTHIYIYTGDQVSVRGRLLSLKFFKVLKLFFPSPTSLATSHPPLSSMSPYMTIPQQYLYISKIRSKLSQCALARHHHRELDLRKMVGHANMLDRILDEIDEIDSEVVLCDAADGPSTAEAHSASSASSDSSPLTNNIRPISIM